MMASHAFRNLASLIETIDSADVAVSSVDTPAQTLADGDSVTAELTVRLDWDGLDGVANVASITLPDGTAVSPDEASVAIPLEVDVGTEDGAAGTEPETSSAKPQVTDGGVAVADASADATELPDEDIEQSEEIEPSEGTDSSEEIEPNEEAEPGEDDGESAPAERDADVDGKSATAEKPHRDPERLREAYESCGTFAEMTEALGVSVTPQTVRYHAIKQGIHCPNERGVVDDIDSECSDGPGGRSDEDPDVTSEESEEKSEQSDGSPDARSYDGEAPSSESDDDSSDTPPDGRQSEVTEDDLPEDVELPSHLALDDLKAAVREAATLYEVQRDLRVDRSRARRLLRNLDLLDLVTGRAATADERDAAPSKIDERIRRACE